MLISRFKSRLSWRLFLVAVPVLAIALAACGGGGSSDASPGDGSSAAEATPAAAMPMSESEESAEAEAYDADAAAAGDEGERASVNQINSQISPDRFIIRSSQITLTVEDVPDAATWVRDLAVRRQGFVFTSNSYVDGEYQYAQVTIRVPADQFDSTITELQDAPFVLQVEREESSSQDVSSEYVDNESRLKALEETERRYLDLLAEADTIDEILRVEYELNIVREQIESIKGRQQYLDEMTAFSTISVSLQPELGMASSSADGSGFFGQIFDDAWDHSEGFLSGVLTLALTLGMVGIVFLPIALVGYVGFRVYRSRSRQPVPAEPESPATP